MDDPIVVSVEVPEPPKPEPIIEPEKNNDLLLGALVERVANLEKKIAEIESGTVEVEAVADSI